MASEVKNVAILGSTGSIGRSTLEVVEAAAGAYRVLALSVHCNTELAIEQARRFRPRWLVATDAAAAAASDWSALPEETELLTDPSAAEEIAAHADVDVVVAAIVGSAGLASTWAAIAAGKTVALANKETLVVAGPLVQRLVKESGAKILPIDSEHSAVLQALSAGRPEEVRRIVLTASGGPFRDHTAEMLSRVTVDEALAHPTWQMGKKITIDSATMMNKALEIVEARWLFDCYGGGDQRDGPPPVGRTFHGRVCRRVGRWPRWARPTCGCRSSTPWAIPIGRTGWQTVWTGGR